MAHYLRDVVAGHREQIGAYGGERVEALLSVLLKLADELIRYDRDAVVPAASYFIPCAAPITGIECHPGEAWPCSRTLTGWALRGILAHNEVNAVMSARAESTPGTLMFDGPDDIHGITETGCPVCEAPTGGRACQNAPVGSPQGTASCADLVAAAQHAT
jgi:hypothetical protein